MVAALIALAGAWILAWGWRLDQRWIDRHVFPYFWHRPRGNWLGWVSKSGIALGVAILACAPLSAVWALRRSPRQVLASWARIGLALLLALVATEVILRSKDMRVGPTRLFAAGLMPALAREAGHEVLGEASSRYGWIWKSSHAATYHTGGRVIDWAFNADRARTRSAGDKIDPARPTILFAGESYAAGHGLQYDETFAALVGAHLGVQPVNLAVNGYAMDQAYLRLVDELPRFAHPVAAVTLLLPVQLGRNILDDRPRVVLGRDGLEVTPASALADLRVYQLLHNDLPYFSESGISASLELSRAMLRDVAAKVRARGAVPLFVFVSIGPPRALEQHFEAWMVQSLLVDQGLPYLLLDLDGDLMLPRDDHPSPKGALFIAGAIERALAAQGVIAARAASPGAAVAH